MSEQMHKSKPFCSLTYLAKSTSSSSVPVRSGIRAQEQEEHPHPKEDHKEQQEQTQLKNSCADVSISGTDPFGTINEEQPSLDGDGAGDLVDGGSIWPWELQRHVDYTYDQADELIDSLHYRQPMLAPGNGNGTGNGGHFDNMYNQSSGGGGGSNASGSGHNSLATCLTSLQSRLNSLECWDYTIELECLKGPQDLQLAAELGKTLLERNKELEILLKEHKTNSEEQEREIVHLRKQITAMSEVNDSRLKVYEQLEVGIQDLERTNHRLNMEKTRDKKQLKSLTANIETLESRCEELTKQLDENRQTLSSERRKNERLLHERNSGISDSSNHFKDRTSANGNNEEVRAYDANTTAIENCSFANKANSTGLNESSLQNDKSIAMSGLSNDGGVANSCEDNEELLKLISDLESTKRAFITEQTRCSEMEEQLVAMINENQTLQTRLAQTSSNEEMMSMHDEFSLLDDVRQGQMCSRCLGAVDDRATNIDEQSSVAPTEEEDERSLLGTESQRDGDQGSELSYQAGVSIKMATRVPELLDLNLRGSPNPYRDLVEKYEALLEVQRSSIVRKNNPVGLTIENGAIGLSLAEEFQTSGALNSTEKLMFQAAAAMITTQVNNETGASSAASATTGNDSKSKSEVRGRTPTEFSEAETSSSGFSDETSNKHTQTDERPGYFLCSIGDGEDCKFSIYDDNSPIDSHFRNRPEYRELFKEIFAVLKKAAENKEEGDKLPLLDDEKQPENEAAPSTANVPPVTPANEDLPMDFGDDTQSIISSAVSEQSFAMSECITKLERKTAKKHITESRHQDKPAMGMASTSSVAQLTATASPSGIKQIIENGRVLTPLKREPLEYVTVGVGIKKKNRRKNRGLHIGSENGVSPLALPTPPPRLYTGGSSGVGSNSSRRARKDFVPMPADMLTQESGRLGRAVRHMATGAAANDWNGSPMIIYNRNLNAARTIRSREFELNGIEYRSSTVSQEFHKLKKLDLSYAEVLRRTDSCEHQHQQLRLQRQQERRRNGKSHNHHH